MGRAAKHRVAIGQERAREAAEVGGGCEQTRVARDAAERPGVSVVDFAPDEAGHEPLVAVEFGRRDQAPLSLRRLETRPLQAERCGDRLGECAIERDAGPLLECPAEQHVAEVAVDDRPRICVARLRVDGVPDRLLAALEAIELAVRGQARAVGE